MCSSRWPSAASLTFFSSARRPATFHDRMRACAGQQRGHALQSGPAWCHFVHAPQGAWPGGLHVANARCKHSLRCMQNMAAPLACFTSGASGGGRMEGSHAGPAGALGFGGARLALGLAALPAGLPLPASASAPSAAAGCAAASATGEGLAASSASSGWAAALRFLGGLHPMDLNECRYPDTWTLPSYTQHQLAAASRPAAPATHMATAAVCAGARLVRLRQRRGARMRSQAAQSIQFAEAEHK